MPCTIFYSPLTNCAAAAHECAGASFAKSRTIQGSNALKKSFGAAPSDISARRTDSVGVF